MSLIKRAAARIPVLGSFLQRAYWRYLEKRSPIPAAPVDPPALKLTVQPDPDFLRSLGYRFESVPLRRTAAPPPLLPPSWPEGELYVVTVCTMNHVPFTRTLLESIRRHHGAVPFVVTVVDAPSRDSVSIDGAVVLTGRDVFGPDLDYMALKVDASELCCAAKPCMIDYLLRHSTVVRRVVYIDSDLYIFAPLETMLARLDDAEFVVCPHIIAPLPRPERFWERPTHLSLTHAGVLNAGIFGMRRSDESAKFIDTWKRLVISPVTTTGAEQHAFNWVSCFVDSVAILRDTAYNVAYWNLHDRSLRYVGGDGENERWTVDGRPLVAFHFSGFSPAAPFQLSRHQSRYTIYVLPAVARLHDFYLQRLEANDRGELKLPYAFDRFPSGIRIDALMRSIFREHEVFLRADVSPWTPDGEAYYASALLKPVPYTMTTLPVLGKRIYDQRPDLVVLGDVSVFPERFMNWLVGGGAAEYHYEDLLDRHRPVVPTHGGAMLLTTLQTKWPQLFEGLAGAVRENRRELIGRLRNIAPHDGDQIRSGSIEHWMISRIAAVRQFMDQRTDLLQAFPDLFFQDATAIVAWLREKRMTEHFLPVEAINCFASRTGGRSLARLFSYVSRTWPTMTAWPLALVGEDSAALARSLLFGLVDTIEYDLDDVEMFLWMMEMTPWAGLPLTLELPVHSTRHPSSRSREGQEQILAPVLGRDERFAAELDRYRQRYPPVEDPAPPSQRTARDIEVFSAIGEPGRRAPLPRVSPGVNVFGYHRSEIGLGQMTRGLVQALGTVGCDTSQAVLTNVRMDDDLYPDDFIRTYDVEKGTNVFVVYPHMQDRLLRTFPDEVIAGHRNISYIAWEQRGGTHYWRDVYADYDQVWALSDFAASSLSEVLQRPVHSVPCVVDATSFPPSSRKEIHRVDPGAFTFLFIFDANSSTERKNPEAIVDAFCKAFRTDDRVRLIIKASSGDRMGNRARLQRLLGAIASHPKIELRVDDLSRTDLYGLISTSDCYVSLHRGEGFGYTCAEAMAYGKPVIATGYSGNMQFMNEKNSYPVRYREVEANVQEGPFQRGSLWAEPDVEHAAELMRHIYENRDEAAAKGALGRETIETELSPAAIGLRVKALLDLDGEVFAQEMPPAEQLAESVEAMPGTASSIRENRHG